LYSLGRFRRIRRSRSSFGSRALERVARTQNQRDASRRRSAAPAAEDFSSSAGGGLGGAGFRRR
jgi:hypothetical protein